MDDSQKELALAKGERDKAVRNSAQVQSRFDDMEVRLRFSIIGHKASHDTHSNANRRMGAVTVKC